MTFIRLVAALTTALSLSLGGVPAIAAAASAAPPQLRVSVTPSTVTKGQVARVCVRTLPNERVNLFAYTLPNRTYKLVRTGVAGAGLRCWNVTPGADTRLFAAVADRSRDSTTAVIKVVAPRPILTLTTKAVAGIPIGTPAATAEAALRRRLGTPTAVYTDGCEVSGVRERRLHWGTAVSVVLSDSITGHMTLSGWTVGKGAAKHQVEMPFNVRVGTPASAALRSIPGAGIEDSIFGYLISSERVPGMLWFLDGAATPGAVGYVSLNPILCD